MKATAVSIWCLSWKQALNNVCCKLECSSAVVYFEIGPCLGYRLPSVASRVPEQEGHGQ